MITKETGRPDCARTLSDRDNFNNNMNINENNIHMKDNPYEKLSAQDEAALFERAQKGCLKSRDRILLAHDQLVHGVANKMLPHNSTALTLEDLVQEGYLGLMRAYERFEVSKNIRFHFFAKFHVADYIRRLVYGQRYQIRLSTGKKVMTARREFYKMRAAMEREALASGDYNFPFDKVRAQLIKVCDIDSETAEMVMLHELCGTVSFDDVVHSEDGMSGTTLSEVIEIPDDGRQADIFETVASNEARKKAMAFLSTKISERDCRIFEMRFMGSEMKFDEIAEQFGITRERVRMICKKASDLILSSFKDSANRTAATSTNWALCREFADLKGAVVTHNDIDNGVGGLAIKPDAHSAAQPAQMHARDNGAGVATLRKVSRIGTVDPVLPASGSIAAAHALDKNGIKPTYDDIPVGLIRTYIDFENKQQGKDNNQAPSDISYGPSITRQDKEKSTKIVSDHVFIYPSDELVQSKTQSKSPYEASRDDLIVFRGNTSAERAFIAAAKELGGMGGDDDCLIPYEDSDLLVGSMVAKQIARRAITINARLERSA